MENQTRYNLETAIENWKQELAAQADLTMEVRRELETHLRDGIAKFQRLGLNDEESFWLACRRVGPPEELSEEFVKANPAAVWRERVLWMALAALVVSLWTVTAGTIYRECLRFLQAPVPVYSFISNPGHYWNNSTFQLMFSALLRTAPIFVVAILLLQGKGSVASKLAPVFRSRSRVLMTAIGWLAVNEVSLTIFWLAGTRAAMAARGHVVSNWQAAHVPVASIWQNLFSTSIWPLALIVLIAWLMTPHDQRVPKQA